MGNFNCLESRQTKLFEANQVPVKNNNNKILKNL